MLFLILNKLMHCDNILSLLRILHTLKKKNGGLYQNCVISFFEISLEKKIRCAFKRKIIHTNSICF